ncbi:MAG: AAC(3) family N-acetyltransferase [Anaerolineaceae bacterium]|nr:AAC(3) family N-acetyltransferase [Anaerolineaceae bacterium]
MPLLGLSHDLLNKSLKNIGVSAGDGLLVHSAIQFLGQPRGGLEMIFNTIREILTPKGTIIVPTFNFDFAKGIDFNTQTTPSKGMGVFSEFVRKEASSVRTSHPLQSIGINGFYASELSSRNTAGAFDPGSAFERMLELNFKLLLLGATINACSMIHYSEQKAAVPYRFWKSFTGLADGKTVTSRMFVRNLDIDPKLSLIPIQKELQDRGLWQEEKVNYGSVISFRLKDFVRIANEMLTDDPFCLLSNRDEIIQLLKK